MIQIQQLKLPITHTKEDMEAKIAKQLRINKEDILSYRIVKQSLDARKKKDIQYVYTIEASTAKDKKIVSRLHCNTIRFTEPKPYQFPASGSGILSERPVIAGSGPAGLFCAHLLAEAGYAPIILERGKTVKERQKDVEQFWKGGKLNPESNVSFGEG